MKVITKIDGKKIELTIDQAKELYSELDKLFGESKTVVYPQIPWVVPQYPNWEPYIYNGPPLSIQYETEGG